MIGNPKQFGGRVVWRIILIAVLTTAVGCHAEISEPKRPDNVPLHAHFVGGVDGGVFIVLEAEPENSGGDYFGVVYHENSGDIWYRGIFYLDPKDSAPIDLNDLNQFEGWDGESILLRDGRGLVAKDAPD